jgi:hypothetical protein
MLLAVCPLCLADGLISFAFGGFEGSGCLAADRELGQVRAPEAGGSVHS